MNQLKVLITIISIITLSSCSTFEASDIPINHSTFYLEVMGNGFADPEKLKKDFNTRAVELCSNNDFYVNNNLRSRVPFAQLPRIAMCKTPGFCPATEASFPVVLGFVSCDGNNNIYASQPPSNIMILSTNMSVTDVGKILKTNIEKCFISSELSMSRQLDFYSDKDPNLMALSLNLGGLFSQPEVFKIQISKISNEQIKLEITEASTPIGSWNFIMDLASIWVGKERNICWSQKNNLKL